MERQNTMVKGCGRAHLMEAARKKPGRRETKNKKESGNQTLPSYTSYAQATPPTTSEECRKVMNPSMNQSSSESRAPMIQSPLDDQIHQMETKSSIYEPFAAGGHFTLHVQTITYKK
jgi:hypothetical protein